MKSENEVKCYNSDYLLNICQTGETVALKKVALRKLEDGIPNQALREIKALQEIEDNQYVSILINQTYYFTTAV